MRNERSPQVPAPILFPPDRISEIFAEQAQATEAFRQNPPTPSPRPRRAAGHDTEHVTADESVKTPVIIDSGAAAQGGEKSTLESLPEDFYTPDIHLVPTPTDRSWEDVKSVLSSSNVSEAEEEITLRPDMADMHIFRDEPGPTSSSITPPPEVVPRVMEIQPVMPVRTIDELKRYKGVPSELPRVSSEVRIARTLLGETAVDRIVQWRRTGSVALDTLKSTIPPEQQGAVMQYLQDKGVNIVPAGSLTHRTVTESVSRNLPKATTMPSDFASSKPVRPVAKNYPPKKDRKKSAWIIGSLVAATAVLGGIEALLYSYNAAYDATEAFCKANAAACLFPQEFLLGGEK